ncbi:hypothetical protein M408DRAFT_192539 [Serendipita vermifera MAFF 305830]|uniref:Uncharacterized protein n=1 Tax=Serendipita vermifera MAFF 305830 TaxID=933852 RepID=A0A0C2WJ44_SERVB|nr:hypothetical protein M408DRAFT_192539 [Serendipita vermifera MAFF 305830]
MPVEYYSDTKYDGPEGIVVAMDIGTTQSAVSFAHFIPKVHPQGQLVTNWPGQADWIAKTPSRVSYQNGTLRACGAEAAMNHENVAYWFKLHLHPALQSDSTSNSAGSNIPPLPVGVTIERVYADLMQYLMFHTKRFFEETTKGGVEIWTRLRSTLIVVLATPNGWDIREQAILRKAAIRALLVTEESAGQLLQFVTEAEASVHYALAQDPCKWLRKKTVFSVIDCGGSTVDTTVYRCIWTKPLSLKETSPSECVQAGGVFVDQEVKEMLERRLEGSPFGHPRVIQSIVDAFERELKPMFNGIIEEYPLEFGAPSDNNPSLGIHNGRITLSNQELKPIFDRVINKIVKGCSSVIISQNAQYVLIVGGFGESPYLKKILQQKLLPYDIELLTVGDSAKKAAAVGAIVKHIKQFVVARATKATFGGCVRQNYDESLHGERKHTVQVYPDGKERVDGVFHMWIMKGTVLQGTFAHKLSYHVAWDAASTSKTELASKLGEIGIEVFAWEGNGVPTWCKEEDGTVSRGMRLICTLNANLSTLAGGLQIKNGPRGKRFYRVDYDVCVYFGGTQLRAKLEWKERGRYREGPVTVMPYIS